MRLLMRWRQIREYSVCCVYLSSEHKRDPVDRYGRLNVNTNENIWKNDINDKDKDKDKDTDTDTDKDKDKNKNKK